MAEWNYNNMNHLSLNLPPSFQPENNSSGSYFNHPVSANLNFGDPSQSRYNNSKFHFGSDLAHNILSLPTTSSYEMSWEINRNFNQHVMLPNVTQPQQQWLNMMNQRKLDQHFVDNFFQARIVPRNCLPSDQITEFRDLVKESKTLTGLLKEAQETSKSCENPKNSHELEQIKERLEFVNEQIEDLATSKEIKDKLTKRKEKREWLKRKKARQKKEAEEAIVRRENLHRLIDNQTEAIRSKELSRKKDLEAKREADVILSDVRRKRNDIQRIRQLLQSLRDLRALRARSLELGRALYSKREDTDNFNNTLDQLDFIIQRKSVDYEEEEKALKSMMNEHNDFKKTEGEIQKLWSKCHNLKRPSEIN